MAEEDDVFGLLRKLLRMNRSEMRPVSPMAAEIVKVVEAQRSDVQQVFSSFNDLHDHVQTLLREYKADETCNPFARPGVACQRDGTMFFAVFHKGFTDQYTYLHHIEVNGDIHESRSPATERSEIKRQITRVLNIHRNESAKPGETQQ